MATAIIYVISSGRFCKIGWTADVRSRLRALSTACPVAPELEHWRLVPRERAIDLERHVHAALDWHRSNGEWFRISPALAEKTIEASRVALNLPNLVFGADRVIREAPPPYQPHLGAPHAG